MGMAAEYFDDGSSFIAIDPLSINPESLTDFSLFERYPRKDGLFRFRCLLVDTTTIDKQRLMDILENWEEIYIHKDEALLYKSYAKQNLKFILNHETIRIEEKTKILVALTTEVIKDAFTSQFSLEADSDRILQNLEKLISKAVDFLSSVESLKGIANLIGHDYDTHTHSVKVGWLSAVFIKSNQDLFGSPDKARLKEMLLQASVAGCLHDIGKVKIPTNVINKPGRLDNLEYLLMQSHPSYGISLLFEKKLPKETMQTILYHHENEDGSGYPGNLVGDQIPLPAKICHIADVFDALTSERPYKRAKTPYEALKIMAGDNPYLDTLKKFEAEACENIGPPLVTIVRDDYEAKLRRLREREMMEQEADKRVEARVKLRDKGMSHCFDVELLKRFIITMNKSESFDLSGLL